MPRCLFATSQCKSPPPLRTVGTNHVTACWFDITQPAELERAAARREARARRLAMLDANAQAIVAASPDGQTASSPNGPPPAN